MKISNLIVISLACYATNLWALANPASVNCVKNGNQLILYKGSTGICVFKDGSYCEEWAYFRETCKPGLNRLAKNMSLKQLNQYCLATKGKQTIFVFCKQNNDNPPKTP